MRRLLKTSAMSVLLVLIVAFTFSISQAQVSNSHHPKYRQGYNQILMGKVVSAQTGQPIANATVTIMKSGVYVDKGTNVKNYGMRVETTVTTNQNGIFLVKFLSPGLHTIKVQKEDYQFWQNTVSLLTGRNYYHRYNGLTSFGYYMHGGNYPFDYSYGSANNKEKQPPFHGFFRPDSDATGFFHGVFSAHHTNNNNMKNDKVAENSYSKGVFLIIRLQKKS